MSNSAMKQEHGMDILESKDVVTRARAGHDACSILPAVTSASQSCAPSAAALNW